jgi:hypothetical protein
MPLNFQINVFKELIEKYAKWEDLRKYLESEDGGLFRVVDNDEKTFCLIRYEKGTTKMDLPHSKWFRSVVWNIETNRPVCISPPKASSEEFPFKTFKELSDAGVVCQELFEGFMINCFKVVGDNALHITSRSKLNAAGKFYSDKSFRELFTEAYMNTIGSTEYSETIIQDNSKDIRNPNVDNNEVAIFYSFLVQHKEHRIVKKLDKNRVYTIHRGVVYSDGRVEIEDSPEKIGNELNIENIVVETKPSKGSYAQIAAQAVENSDDEVQRWIKKEMSQNDWQFQGLVFKDSVGNRWRFRSERYAGVKTLRGNSPLIRDRFSQLFCENLIQKYLEYYVDDAVPMMLHFMLIHTIIKTLYDNYVDLHITKTKKVEEIDKMYLPHLYTIHGMYLSQLRPLGKKININEITLYLHKQPWQRVSFLLKKAFEEINSLQSDVMNST